MLAASMPRAPARRRAILARSPSRSGRGPTRWRLALRRARGFLALGLASLGLLTGGGLLRRRLSLGRLLACRHRGAASAHLGQLKIRRRLPNRPASSVTI